MKVYDDDYSLVKSFQPHKLGITGVKQIPFNDYVVTTDIDEVKIWDPTNNIWSLIRSYTSHVDNVLGFEVINAEWVVSGAGFGSQSIRVCSTRTCVTNMTITTDSTFIQNIGQRNYMLGVVKCFHVQWVL